MQRIALNQLVPYELKWTDIDETSYCIGHKYVAVVVDHDTNNGTKWIRVVQWVIDYMNAWERNYSKKTNKKSFSV